MPDSDIVEIGKTAGTGFGGLALGIAAKMWHSRKAVSGRLKRVEGKIDEIQAERAASDQESIDHRAQIWEAIKALNETITRMDAKLDTTTETLQFIRGQITGRGNRGRS